MNNAGLNHKISGDTVYNFWQIYHHLGGGVQSLLVKWDENFGRIKKRLT